MTLFEKIYEKLDFHELVSLRVSLKQKHGDKYTGLSPFSSEKTPSFHIDAEKKLYSCFSTGKSGGFLSYVQETENLSKEDALTFLADYCDIIVDEAETTDERLRKILKYASEYYQRSADVAREYFKHRRLDAELVSQFSVGYSDGTVLNYLKSLGYTADEMDKAGVAYKHTDDKGNVKYVDYFYKRVVFPIFDFADRVVSFTGRLVEDRENSPKYLHGRTNTVFKGKSQILYGLKQCRRLITDKICVTEGVFDAIAVQSAGIPAVAILGASPSTVQITALSKLSSDIYFVIDSDNAGKEGLLKAMTTIKDANLDIISYTTIFTETKDAAEYLPLYGKKALREKIEGSPSDMVSLVRILAQSYKMKGKQDSFVAHKVIKELKERFSYKPDYRSLEMIDALASEFNYPKSHIQKVILEANKDNHFNNAPRAYAMLAPGEIDVKVYERRFLCIILKYPHLWKQCVEEGVDYQAFANPVISKVFETISGEKTVFLELEEVLTKEELAFTISLYNTTSVDISSFESLLKTIKIKSKQREVAATNRSQKKRGMLYEPLIRDYARIVKDRLEGS